MSHFSNNDNSRFLSIYIEEEAKKKGLDINENKTEYMHCSRRNKIQLTSLKIERFNLEEIETFQ